MQALIDEIRTRWVDADIRAFTLTPSDTAVRHRIVAHSISGISAPRFKVTRRPPGRRAVRFMRRLERVPGLGRLLRVIWESGRTLRAELAHVRLAYRQSSELDLLVVTGGTLDERRASAWGHPYVLYKWAKLARLTRTKFVVLGAGLSPPLSLLARFYLGRALRVAVYRSFRDAASADIARKLNAPAEGPVLSDLALGGARRLRRTPPRNRTLTVAVNPIAHRDPRTHPLPDAAAYSRLMHVYATFVSCLVEEGLTVVLFATDARDRMAVNDLQHQLRPDVLARFSQRIRHAHIEESEQLIEELEHVDCVIASRMHDIVTSHGLGVPVLALAHNRAVVAHMSDLRQRAHCLEIDHLQVARLVRAFRTLADDLPHAAASVRAATELARRALASQYERVFSLIVPDA